MVKEKFGVGGGTGENEWEQASQAHTLPRLFPARLTNSALSAIMGLWGESSSLLYSLGCSPPTTPLPPQLQQTEAELRKMDEAIALFQKML